MPNIDLTHLTHVGRWTVAEGYADKCTCTYQIFPESLCPQKVAAALAEKDALLDSLSELLDSGREFNADGTERPTTLLERLAMINLCLAAESLGGDAARRALADAQDTIAEYRRCIQVALDEQRELGEKQDVGVLMTDLEDLLDQMEPSEEGDSEESE